MEAVIFVGLQGAGKSSFYAERFFRTHIRINLDMLRTRRRENLLIEACLAAQQRFVVDNTNASVAERAKYIEAAKAAGFEVVCYYFSSKIDECLARNAARAERVPDEAVLGTYGRLEIPSPTEGFDQMYYVRLAEQFVVEDWEDEL